MHELNNHYLIHLNENLIKPVGIFSSALEMKSIKNIKLYKDVQPVI